MAERKKRMATIQKNLVEMEQKLIQLEEELEAAKEERYLSIGRMFDEIFDSVPEFDLINMSNRQLRNFIWKVRCDYRPSYQDTFGENQEESEEDSFFF